MLRDTLAPLTCVLALRGLATWFAVSAGFSGISDDDFARVVIAQQFAERPAWDPSGSSWLPLPFWLNGGAMLLLGAHFWVARLISILLSLASAGSVWLSARWLGLSPRAAFWAGAAGALLPHAVWLGYATVPDGFSASLCLLATASTARGDLRSRIGGALLIACATLCRYETWAVAAVLGVVNTHTAFRSRRWLLLAPAALCAAGPLGWIAHGLLTHGDPLFFVSRVADYRRLLGRSPGTLASALLGYPSVLLRAEPELLVGSMLTLAARTQTRLPAKLRMLTWAILGLTGFLIWGDLRDGAPTHHPERPLLFVWLGLCVALGWALPLMWARRRAWIVGVGVAAVTAVVLRPSITRRDSFVDRREELAFGRSARELIAPSERLLVDVGDYGYFAVIAGFERPTHAHGLADNDPRQDPRQFASPTRRLRHHARAERASWIVVRTSALDSLDGFAEPVMQSKRLALLRAPTP